MLTCPQCQTVNPHDNKFCQGCGRSLNHHVCHACGGEVKFDAENCPQCHTISGTYRWAIIEQSQNQELTATIPSEIPILVDRVPDSVSLTLETDEDPWADPVAANELPIDRAAETVVVTDLPVDRLPELETTIEPTPPPTPIPVLAPIPTTYLDRECHYLLLDPIVIQLLTPTDSCQVRVIDLQPFHKSPLEILTEQQPVVSITYQPDRQPSEYPQWEFWQTCGISPTTQAYIALKSGLPGTIPSIHDAWNDDGKVISILEDRSQWKRLLDRWGDLEIPPSQIIYWLDFTLKLWIALTPWQMRQSLLELDNLLIDEDGTICFQRLASESRELDLTDLTVMWQSLFDRSAHKCPEIDKLIKSIEHRELTQVEQVRAKLADIAQNIEPRQVSGALLSADLSASQDALTVAMAQKLVDLEESAATHTGKKRDHNEDCFGIVSNIERKYDPKGASISARGLYILCDGMGGHAGGEIASKMTVDSLQDYFAVHWGDALPDEEIIREGIVAANEAVYEINQQKAASGSGRMGTTLVLVLVQDRNIAIAHVGDSRCYAITPTQGLIQLTLDHEVGQQQILRGVDPDIAYGRPDSYQLTQAIGPRDRNYIQPEIKFFELQEDTLILLASDGLTDNQLLENHWSTNVAPLLSSGFNLQQGVDRLIDFANEYNGHDNITALVVRAKMG